MWKILLLKIWPLQNQFLNNFEEVIAKKRFSSFSTFWNFCPLVVCCPWRGSFDKESNTPRVCSNSKGSASTWQVVTILILLPSTPLVCCTWRGSALVAPRFWDDQLQMHSAHSFSSNFLLYVESSKSWQVLWYIKTYLHFYFADITKS